MRGTGGRGRSSHTRRPAKGVAAGRRRIPAAEAARPKEDPALDPEAAGSGGGGGPAGAGGGLLATIGGCGRGTGGDGRWGRRRTGGGSQGRSFSVGQRPDRGEKRKGWADVDESRGCPRSEG